MQYLSFTLASAMLPTPQWRNPMTNQLKLWLQQSTTAQKQKLAELASTSIPSLRLAANGYRTDRMVDLSVDFAARIEQAAAQVDLNIPVRREHLCTTCAKCPYQIKCNNS